MSTVISERRVVVDGISVLVRERAGDGIPAVFVHGNPTTSSDWTPFMERLDGPALAFDLPGFGRSGRPDPAGFDHSMGTYADFVGHLLDELGASAYGLVVHDWGALALVTAQRHPERVRRLVVINAVPLSAGYRWHWIARLWRRRGVGELLNATNTKTMTAQLMRLARPGRRAMPPELIDETWSNWDRGTSRAVLALYRSADADVLGAAGIRLDDLRCPALVLWGAEDPYIGIEQGRWYAAALGDAELEPVEGAGHWPWIDRPEVIDRVAAHLAPLA